MQIARNVTFQRFAGGSFLFSSVLFFTPYFVGNNEILPGQIETQAPIFWK